MRRYDHFKCAHNTVCNGSRAPPGPALSLYPNKIPNLENLIQISPSICQKLINLPFFDLINGSFAKACLIPIGFVDFPSLKLFTQPPIRMFMDHVRNLADQQMVPSYYQPKPSFCTSLSRFLNNENGFFQPSGSPIFRPATNEWYNFPFKRHELRYLRNEYDFNSNIPILCKQGKKNFTKLPDFSQPEPVMYTMKKHDPLYPQKKSKSKYPKNELGWTKLPELNGTHFKRICLSNNL